MKFVGISDQHGILRDLKEPADVLLVAGDIVPLRFQTYSKDSKKWFKEVYIPWCKAQPVESVVCVAGNHDFWLERHGNEFKDMTRNTKIIYLENEIHTILREGKKYIIYGTPLCKPFGLWAFMKPLEMLGEIFKDVPGLIEKEKEGTEEVKTILLSHDGPYGCSDIILQKSCRWYDGKTHIGNSALTSLVSEIKPDIQIHGHLHTTNHDPEFLGDTEVRCVSVLDENYEVAYDPMYFEL